MLLQNRIYFVEQTGFKIIEVNNKPQIIDIENNEKLRVSEEGQYFGKKYKGKYKEIIFKNSGAVEVKLNKALITTISGGDLEETITIKDKDIRLEITTTLEKMMHKVGSITIKEYKNNKKTTNDFEFIQRIEKGEINTNINGKVNHIKLTLDECNEETIINCILNYINTTKQLKKIIMIIPILQKNIERIEDSFIEKIDKYIEGLEIEDPQNKLPVLRQYKKKTIIKTKQLKKQ